VSTLLLSGSHGKFSKKAYRDIELGTSESDSSSEPDSDGDKISYKDEDSDSDTDSGSVSDVENNSVGSDHQTAPKEMHF